MVPVSWQSGSELSRARPMLHPMTFSATSAFEPSTSSLRAPVTARTTSSGSCVDVRRISSRMLSNSADSLETSWSGAVAVIVRSLYPNGGRSELHRSQHGDDIAHLREAH